MIVKKGYKIELINEIANFIYGFKNKIVEAPVIANEYEEKISSFAKELKNLEFDKEFEENFLIILGYSYRLEDIKQRLFFTFSEAVYAIDLDKLMRNEDSLKLNSIVYILVLDSIIKEYKTKEVNIEQKQKAVDVYKKIEERKAAENKKYHMYQY
ncbi:hypothetical protein AVENP_2132 [Arcobacter venerupis]|uniref:Uncharacterized protein n=1 Tax=Arcobacter venerupis TaxID=1054033 RepID=A0AAE7E492_9BACT|nr:hypothetical protein [Arcobacter venerupis]QKF67660.1 hypothetical protein AVENP_2132 [Arcobacter venerupis]RWS49182.1 hypothetical protein CKA56_10615 [Arcobacter venerupis]